MNIFWAILTCSVPRLYGVVWHPVFDPNTQGCLMLLLLWHVFTIRNVFLWCAVPPNLDVTLNISHARPLNHNLSLISKINTFVNCSFVIIFISQTSGLKQMRATMKNVDCIIEIHDARISFGWAVETTSYYSIDSVVQRLKWKKVLKISASIEMHLGIPKRHQITMFHYVPPFFNFDTSRSLEETLYSRRLWMWGHTCLFSTRWIWLIYPLNRYSTHQLNSQFLSTRECGALFTKGIIHPRWIMHNPTH